VNRRDALTSAQHIYTPVCICWRASANADLIVDQGKLIQGQLGSRFSIQLCKSYLPRLVGWLGGRADGLLRANVCCTHASLRANVCCTHANDPRKRRMSGGVVLRARLRFRCNGDLLRASVRYTQASECECGRCTSERLCARAGGCVVWGLDAEKLSIENTLACLVGGGALRGMVHKPKTKQAPTQAAGH
jgi:hypothetical protein